MSLMTKQLENVRSQLTPGAIRRADLDGMAMIINDVIKHIDHIEAVCEKHYTDLESLRASFPQMKQVVMEKCGDCGGDGEGQEQVEQCMEQCFKCLGDGEVPKRCRCPECVVLNGDIQHLDVGCTHGHHGYATVDVPAVIGMTAWCYRNNKAYELILTGIEMRNDDELCFTSLTFRLKHGQGVDDISTLDIQPDDCFPDAISAELIGGAG